jgi:hypothetical protein
MMGTETPSRRKPGRPPVLEEDWAKVTVVLLNRQIAFLDHLSAEIRSRSGAAVRRSEIIRTLIDFLERSGLDLKSSSSETDIRMMLQGLVSGVGGVDNREEGRK